MGLISTRPAWIFLVLTDSFWVERRKTVWGTLSLLGSGVDRVDLSWRRVEQGRLDMVVALSLQDFVLRARVLKLYRQALRATKRAPSPAKAELRLTIRQEMELNRGCKDKQTIRFLMSDGLERIKRLNEMLDMQGHHS